jgi:hypothetical protein
MVNCEHGSGRRFVRVVQEAHEWLHFYLNMGVNRREKPPKRREVEEIQGDVGSWRSEVGNRKSEEILLAGGRGWAGG